MKSSSSCLGRLTTTIHRRRAEFLLQNYPDCPSLQLKRQLRDDAELQAEDTATSPAAPDAAFYEEQKQKRETRNRFAATAEEKWSTAIGRAPRDRDTSRNTRTSGFCGTHGGFARHPLRLHELGKLSAENSAHTSWLEARKEKCDEVFVERLRKAVGEEEEQKDHMDGSSGGAWCSQHAQEGVRSTPTKCTSSSSDDTTEQQTAGALLEENLRVKQQIQATMPDADVFRKDHVARLLRENRTLNEGQVGATPRAVLGQESKAAAHDLPGGFESIRSEPPSCANDLAEQQGEAPAQKERRLVSSGEEPAPAQRNCGAETAHEEAGLLEAARIDNAEADAVFESGLPKTNIWNEKRATTLAAVWERVLAAGIAAKRPRQEVQAEAERVERLFGRSSSSSSGPLRGTKKMGKPSFFDADLDWGEVNDCILPMGLLQTRMAGREKTSGASPQQTPPDSTPSPQNDQHHHDHHHHLPLSTAHTVALSRRPRPPHHEHHPPAVLFDTSFRHIFAISGRDRCVVADHFLTADLKKMQANDIQYTCVLDTMARILDVGFVVKSTTAFYRAGTTCAGGSPSDKIYVLLDGADAKQTFEYLQNYLMYTKQTGLDVAISSSVCGGLADGFFGGSSLETSSTWGDEPSGRIFRGVNGSCGACSKMTASVEIAGAGTCAAVAGAIERMRENGVFVQDGKEAGVEGARTEEQSCRTSTMEPVLEALPTNSCLSFRGTPASAFAQNRGPFGTTPAEHQNRYALNDDELLELHFCRVSLTGGDGFTVFGHDEMVKAFSECFFSSEHQTEVGEAQTYLGGYQAWDLLRLEAGHVRMGVDLQPGLVSPVRASLSWTIAQGKLRNHVLFGWQILFRHLAKGPERRRVGVVLEAGGVGGLRRGGDKDAGNEASLGALHDSETESDGDALAESGRGTSVESDNYEKRPSASADNQQNYSSCSDFAHPGAVILSDAGMTRRIVGSMTSVAFSPTLRKRIGFAYIRPEYAVHGGKIFVSVLLDLPAHKMRGERLKWQLKQGINRANYRKLVPARVVSLPFIRHAEAVMGCDAAGAD